MGVYSNDRHSKKESEVKAIEEKLSEISGLYYECEQIAREHNLSFSYSGPAGYGDGGSFDAERTEDQWGDESDGWLASSQSC